MMDESAERAVISRRYELSNAMHTREMKFLAALLGDGIYDLRYSRPSLVEIFRGIFIYSESDRMAIYKWREGCLPVEIFSAKDEITYERVQVQCECGDLFTEYWGNDRVTDKDRNPVNIFEQRFCKSECAEGAKSFGKKDIEFANGE